MTRWFRFYGEAIDDPKVQRLTPTLFKSWVNMLCIASTNNGVLPHVDDVAFRLRSSVHDAQSQIDELIGLGLLDIRRDRMIEPHNWVKRQFVSDRSTWRVRKHRESKSKTACNGDETFHVTPPDTDTDTDTEQNPPKPPLEGGRAALDFSRSKSRRRNRAAEMAAAIARLEAADEGRD